MYAARQTHRDKQNNSCDGMRYVEQMIVHLSDAAQGKEEEDIHAAERDAAPTMIGLHVRRDASLVGPFGD